MIQQSILIKPSSFSSPSPFPRNPKCCKFHRPLPSHSISTIRCEAADSSSLSFSSKIGGEQPSSSSPASNLMESEKKNGPYPGGLGPYTGRDPNVKKPAWLRQKAPQGYRFEEIKESLSHLKLNTVCEEAQCPNIGEVLLHLIFFDNSCSSSKFPVQFFVTVFL